MNNFYQALFQANLLYGLEMSSQDFAEIGLNAWNFIGNKTTKLYQYSTKINQEDLSIELPCNADIIEAITIPDLDWNYVTNKHNNGDLSSKTIETWIEGQKLNTSPLYTSGQYVKYERVGDKLYFDRNYGTVNILYKGIVLDEEGLPELSDKEVIAIATYVAYVQKYKQGIMTNNANIIQVANLLKADWLRYCDAARVPDYINQNEMNEILNIKTSWDRKTYNKSYKGIK